MAHGINGASISLSQATRYMAMAAADELNGKMVSPWLRLAVESLTETANALGYVLIPISGKPDTSPQVTEVAS